MSYLVDFQPLALKAMRLEALLPTKALTPTKDKVHIDRDTVSLFCLFYLSIHIKKEKHNLHVCNHISRNMHAV